MAMEWKDVSSEFILKVGYDEETEELEMIFYDEDGAVVDYTYHNFPKDVFDEFMKSSSQGEYFNYQIRNNFRWTKG